MYVSMYESVYLSMYACMYICIYVCKSCRYACMYVSMYERVYVSIYVYMHVCMYLSITPTILYACTSWTLTKDLATTLIRTQRRMLRLTIGTPRRLQQHQQQDGNILPDTQHDNSTSIDDNLTQFIHQTQNDSLEPWSEYIQRSTRIADAAMTRHNITDWVTTYYRRTWRWAQRITNLPTNRWSHLVTNWKPDVSETRPVYRKQGRPHKRWHDDIDDCNSSLNQHDTDSHYSWRESTTEDYWRKHEKAFVKFCWR